jgi:predicted DNA-binding ribbon-helix-helix protein
MAKARLRIISIRSIKRHGYKTALFSKPYFYKVNEMMQINGKMINDADFARIFSAKEERNQSGNLSSFEIETYIAFAYFNEQKPDLAIIECGMGGAPIAPILPGDSFIEHHHDRLFEHTAFLGRTVSEIALQQRRHHQTRSPDCSWGISMKRPSKVLKRYCQTEPFALLRGGCLS